MLYYSSMIPREIENPFGVQKFELPKNGLLVIICDPENNGGEFWRGVMSLTPESSRDELKATLLSFRRAHAQDCLYPTITPHLPNQVELYPLPIA